MLTILWILAVVLVIAGIVQLVQGQVLAGLALIVIGFLVGPGGVSIFATNPLIGASSAVLVAKPLCDLRPPVPRRRSGSDHGGTAAHKP
jgi:hypothetical protein